MAGPRESKEQDWGTGTGRTGQKDVSRAPKEARPESRRPETPAWQDPAQEGRLSELQGQTVAEVWRLVTSMFGLGSVPLTWRVSLTFARTL